MSKCGRPLNWMATYEYGAIYLLFGSKCGRPLNWMATGASLGDRPTAGCRNAVAISLDGDSKFIAGFVNSPSKCGRPLIGWRPNSVRRYHDTDGLSKCGRPLIGWRPPCGCTIVSASRNAVALSLDGDRTSSASGAASAGRNAVALSLDGDNADVAELEYAEVEMRSPSHWMTTTRIRRDGRRCRNAVALSLDGDQAHRNAEMLICQKVEMRSPSHWMATSKTTW